MARIEAGVEPEPRRLVYRKLDERLINLVKNFNEEIHDGSYIPYLKSIAHNLNF